MTTLITGGSGFLGSALAANLCYKGEKVVIVVRPNSSLERLQNISDQISIKRCSQNCELHEIVATVNPDTVIHTACTYGRNQETMFEMYETNVNMGLTILKAISERSISTEKFINVGTVLDPLVSKYALTKNIFSDLAREIASEIDNLHFVNVRLQHMFGPNDSANKFITHVMRSCINNIDILNLTAGDQFRDFIYIDDVVNAFWTIQKYLPQTICDIDVGSGDAPTIRKTAETIASITQSSTKLNFGAIPYRENENMDCRANINRLVSLGWIRKFNLEEGLRETIKMERLL